MGRYFKFWVNDENEEFLNTQENWGGTINKAIAGLAVMEKSRPKWEEADKKFRAEPQAVDKKDFLLCPNGHMLVDDKHCMVKNCKYAKK